MSSLFFLLRFFYFWPHQAVHGLQLLVFQFMPTLLPVWSVLFLPTLPLPSIPLRNQGKIQHLPTAREGQEFPEDLGYRKTACQLKICTKNYPNSNIARACITQESWQYPWTHRIVIHKVQNCSKIVQQCSSHISIYNCFQLHQYQSDLGWTVLFWVIWYDFSSSQNILWVLRMRQCGDSWFWPCSKVLVIF